MNLHPYNDRGRGWCRCGSCPMCRIDDHPIVDGQYKHLKGFDNLGNRPERPGTRLAKRLAEERLEAGRA